MYRFLISGYNAGPEALGIRTCELDLDRSALKTIGETSGMASPSYCQKVGDDLYVACETSEHGGFAYCQVDPFGVPQLVNQVVFPDAAGTTFTLRHPSGKHVYGADYNSGSVASCKLGDDGSLREPVRIVQHKGHGFPRPDGYVNFDRQLAPHVHTMSMVPGTSLLATVDLGLDMIVLYETDEEGTIVDHEGPIELCAWPDGLAPDADSYAMREAVPAAYAGNAVSTLTEGDGASDAKVRLTRSLPEAGSECVAELPVRPAAIVEAPPCAGPRIVTYHPTKPLVAVVCELSCEVIVFRIADDGKRWEAQSRIDLLKDVGDPMVGGEAPRGAQCAFTRDGRFMYAATRGVDIMTTFSLDDDCNVLSRSDCPSGGKTPRLMAMSPDERLIAVTNHDSNLVQLFQRDSGTGALSALMGIDFTTPSCVVWE